MMAHAKPNKMHRMPRVENMRRNTAVPMFVHVSLKPQECLRFECL